MNQGSIRNFSIIAHVDHGKSTLSDRLIELTGTVDKRDMREQLLDSNPIERERGVTIKLAPVTMNFTLHAIRYTLNLIDTPGHVDFSYEVERSLAACEGAILLVDATQGIQAQTLAHGQKALELGLTIIPVINKIDLDSARPEVVATEMHDVLGFGEKEITKISAKLGIGIDQIITRVVKEIPSPRGASDAPLRALVFNSIFEPHLGVIAFIRVVDGSLKEGELINFLATKQAVTPKEIGVFTPTRHSVDTLSTGQVGYVATGLKDIRSVHVGDTVTLSSLRFPLSAFSPLPGYRRPTPMVFANIFPGATTTYQRLLDAVEKLRLSDASLAIVPAHSSVLGPGLEMGFLGLFHMAITKERLEREYDLDTTVTTPTVAYIVHGTNDKITTVKNPHHFPDPSSIKEILEPMAKATIISPSDAVGPLMRVMENRRARYQDTAYFGGRAKLSYLIPLAELVSGLFDELKSASHGFASLDYELTDPQPVDAVKLELLVHHDPVEPLSRIVVRDQAGRIGRIMVERFKELLPAQQFAVPIQAAVGGHILARETKPAFRKDVTAKLYGGDQTRKDKLLKKQKKGKKKMARIGNVNIPDDVLTQMALS